MNLKSKLINKYKTKIRVLKNEFETVKMNESKNLFFDSLSMQVSPSIIQEYTTHITINYEIMAKCIILGVPHRNVDGYPRDINPRFIDELLSLSTENYIIAYSFAAIPISNSESMKMLDNALFYNRVNQADYTKHNDDNASIKLDLDREDFLANYRMLHNNTQKMLHSAFIIIIWAREMKEMREAESKIRTILEANRIHYEFPYCRMLDTFLAAQPYPTSASYCWTELFTNYAATLAATRNPNSYTSDEGLYFGDDIKTGKNVLINLKALAAQHLMFTGMTGSGKSFTLLMLLMRALDILGKRVIYTTPKADKGTDFKNVAEYYKDIATIIDIGANGKNINPLQILYDESNSVTIRDFDNQFELLIQFYRLLFEGSQTINMTSYLNESILEAYRYKGIIRESPETYKNEAPTMLDVRNIWKRDANNEELGSRARTAQALVDKSFMIETSWSYMNKKSSDINYSADFIVIDISDIPESLREAMNVFVTGIMGMRFRTDTKKETIIACDEAAVFLRNPSLCSFLLKLLTQGRSFNIALWLATQQTGDLIKAGVDEEFKTNISISIVLGNMRKDSIGHVKNFYKLSEDDTNTLMTMGVGEGLIIVGNEVIPTKFVPTDHEMSIIKGKTKKIEDISLNKINDLGIVLKDSRLAPLISNHGICFSEWVDGDPSILVHHGYEPSLEYKPIGRGTLNAWIKTNIIENDKIGNQKKDHYASVMYTAGYLVMNDFEEVTINHYDNVDVSAKYKGKSISFEVELANSHNKQELIDKRQFALDNYENVIFIGTSTNIKDLIEALGSKYVISRGNNLLKYIEIFKNNIDNDTDVSINDLITPNKITKPQNGDKSIFDKINIHDDTNEVVDTI